MNKPPIKTWDDVVHHYKALMAAMYPPVIRPKRTFNQCCRSFSRFAKAVNRGIETSIITDVTWSTVTLSCISIELPS
jgi:hypothetical protein